MRVRVFFVVSFLAGSLSLLTACASAKPFGTVDARRMAPAELIQTLGRPARIISGKRVFGFGGHWVRGAREYRYYLVDRHHEVTYWSFFYKDEEWLSETVPMDTVGLSLLDVSCERDRKLINSFEAAHSWLR